MKIAVHTTFCLAAVLASQFTATAALAQTQGPEPDYSIGYNVGAVSDYRVRGIAQTGFKPAVQGGIDFAHKSGLYLGTFGSNVNWVKDFNGATKGALELDVYGGYKDEIVSGLAFDAGVISYRYLRNNSGAAGTPGAGNFANASTTEVYLNLNYGIFNAKYNRSLGNFLGNLDSKGSQYIDLNAGVDLGNGFTLTPHIGRQWIPNQGLNGNQANYSDASLALAKDFGDGLSGTVTALRTTTKKGAGTFYRDLKDHDLGKTALTVGVKYSF